MPNRILREGILTSERVNRLDWPAEVFYRRLMSIVDDFGRYTANPKLLKAVLYPLQIDKVRDANIAQWLDQLIAARLVRVYTQSGACGARSEPNSVAIDDRDDIQSVTIGDRCSNQSASSADRDRSDCHASVACDGNVSGSIAARSGGDKRYFLELIDFRQQMRIKISKYPDPDGHGHAKQTHSRRIAYAHLDGDGDGDGDEKQWSPSSNGQPGDNSNTYQDFINKQAINGQCNGRKEIYKLAKNPISDGEICHKFNRFWQEWPKKEKRKRGLEIWKSKHLDNRVDNLVLDVVWRKANCYKWLRGYIPNVTTYLNQEIWNDERITLEQARQRNLIGVGNHECYESDDLPEF